MKKRILSLTIATLLALPALAATAPETPAKTDAPDAEQSATPGKKAKRALEKGMPAEEVIRLIGKPAEIKPMETTEGKAETWIYRRELGHQTRQVVTGMRQVPTYVGPGMGDGADAQSGMSMRGEPIYQMETTTTYQVTSLLMFDGKLELARQTSERTRNYTKN